MLRVLILMSNTGDGHRASAEALQAGFQRLPGDFALGQAGLLRFFVKGVGKLVAKSNSKRVIHGTSVTQSWQWCNTRVSAAQPTHRNSRLDSLMKVIQSLA